MDKKAEPQCCADTVQKRRLLWCSEPNWKRSSVLEYYSDKLMLLKLDDGLFALELSVGGTVVRLPIKDKDRYLI